MAQNANQTFGEGVKSATRALTVLDLFSQARRPLAARTIAETLAIPRSTVNVLLRSLIAEGYVQFDPDTMLYLPTLKVALLGMWLAEDRLASPRLSRLVAELADKTAETVCVWVRAGLTARLLVLRDSPQPVALNLSVGDSAPLFGSAVGLALLAAMAEAEVLALLRQHNAAAPESARQDPALLLAELARIRAQGYAAAYGRWLPEAGALATALPGAPGSEPLVIAVGGPASRIQPREATLAAVLLAEVSGMRAAA